VVEREIPFTFGGRPELRLALRNPDLTTARRMAVAINSFAGAGTATATDPQSPPCQI
jgi:flagellar P-ring protein precursor FlgI